MQLIVTRRLQNFHKFGQIAHRIQNKTVQRELHRGVIDAGRKTRTQVRKAVREQMGVAPGSYTSYVVANTGLRSGGNLQVSIWASAKGGQITDFKGLKALSPKGRLARRTNKGKNFPGLVRSEVWNQSRVFKRSFAQNGGYFALIRASGAPSNSTMPRAFWTADNHLTQPRDAMGRFADTGAQKWRLRRLRGPAINKELDKGQSLHVFMTFGPAELERQTNKRIDRILKW